MKKLLTALAFAFIATTVQAQDINLDACTRISRLAAGAMEARQTGGSITELLEIASAVKNDTLKRLANIIAVSAFEKPVHSSKDMRESAIESFKNEWFFTCMEAQR